MIKFHAVKYQDNTDVLIIYKRQFQIDILKKYY